MTDRTTYYLCRECDRFHYEDQAIFETHFRYREREPKELVVEEENAD